MRARVAKLEALISRRGVIKYHERVGIVIVERTSPIIDAALMDAPSRARVRHRDLVDDAACQQKRCVLDQTHVLQ